MPVLEENWLARQPLGIAAGWFVLLRGAALVNCVVQMLTQFQMDAAATIVGQGSATSETKTKTTLVVFPGLWMICHMSRRRMITLNMSRATNGSGCGNVRFLQREGRRRLGKCRNRRRPFFSTHINPSPSVSSE
jgi:hypothetical protein